MFHSTGNEVRPINEVRASLYPNDWIKPHQRYPWGQTARLYSIGPWQWNAFYKQCQDEFRRQRKWVYGQRVFMGGIFNRINLSLDHKYRDLEKQAADAGKKAYEGTKFHIIRSPIYAIKGAWKVGRFGLFVGNKFLWYTPPGRWLRAVGSIYLVGRMGYVYGTGGHEIITIAHKHNRIGDDNEAESDNEYLIQDEKGRMFKVRNSFWYRQFLSTELWSSMREGHRYRVTYYGVRLAWRGIYPSVVQAERIN